MEPVQAWRATRIGQWFKSMVHPNLRGYPARWAPTMVTICTWVSLSKRSWLAVDLSATRRLVHVGMTTLWSGITTAGMVTTRRLRRSFDHLATRNTFSYTSSNLRSSLSQLSSPAARCAASAYRFIFSGSSRIAFKALASDLALPSSNVSPTP